MSMYGCMYLDVSAYEFVCESVCTCAFVCVCVCALTGHIVSLQGIRAGEKAEMYMLYGRTKNRYGPFAQITKVRMFMVLRHNKLPPSQHSRCDGWAGPAELRRPACH